MLIFFRPIYCTECPFLLILKRVKQSTRNIAVIVLLCISSSPVLFSFSQALYVRQHLESPHLDRIWVRVVGLVISVEQVPRDLLVGTLSDLLIWFIIQAHQQRCRNWFPLGSQGLCYPPPSSPTCCSDFQAGAVPHTLMLANLYLPVGLCSLFL